MNIIYKNDAEISVTNTTDNDLKSLTIYIPIGNCYDFFILHIDDVIIDLNKTESQKANYEAFVPNPTKYVNLKNGSHEFILYCLDTSAKQNFISISKKISVQFDEYNENYINRLSSIINQNVSDKYDKIIKLTELNMKIYDAVKSIGLKDTNLEE